MIPPTRALCCLSLALALPASLVRAGAPAAASDGAGGLPFIEVFEPRDYSGHAQVWAAVESKSGVMYFGNLGRVLSFDGARWSHFEVPDTSFVRALCRRCATTLVPWSTRAMSWSA